jgi:hypothetical protein
MWGGGNMSSKQLAQKHIAQPEQIDADIRQITEALAKIRDPVARYFFAMFIELMAERIADLVDAHDCTPDTLLRMATLHRVFAKSSENRTQHG